MPRGELNPMVIKAMEEIGYDMSSHYSKLMTLEMVESADKVITMGCGVNLDDIEHVGVVCPAVFVESEDWGLEDPKGQPIEKVREIRDEIKKRVEELIWKV
jgi:arsenate reductase (thioredoxin)